MLKIATPREWAQKALTEFDAFLLDHASCERKASAVGLSFVVRYPDRKEIIEPMIQFSREELEHFHQVYRLIAERGLTLGRDEEDTYVNVMMQHVRFGRDERFLDRLIVSSVIEARGAERLKLIEENVSEERLKTFYGRLARAEAHHRTFFLDMAAYYFPQGTIQERLDAFLDIEAEAISSVPFRAALH